jgi:hypothetical protein
MVAWLCKQLSRVLSGFMVIPGAPIFDRLQPFPPVSIVRKYLAEMRESRRSSRYTDNFAISIFSTTASTDRNSCAFPKIVSGVKQRRGAINDRLMRR